MEVKAIAYGVMSERVFARAAVHARKSSDPEGFMDFFRADMKSLRKDVSASMEPPVGADPLLCSDDPVRLAAEIEAWGAIRMALTYHHAAKCHCDACKVKRRQASKSS